MKAKGVEAVAVCLLWSIINPAHEERVGALLEEHLPGVPYTLSHRLNPTVREYRRASSAAIDASLKPLMSAYFRKLDEDLRKEGFDGRLLVLTGSGGVLDAADIWNTPIHVIGSGPAAAPVAGRHFAKLDAGTDYAVVTDAGGTTYDVSLIRRGAIPWTRETLVGPVGQRHITGFPSVDSRSIGAGGGSIGWVDRGGLLHVGPQSAGAEPGPACWGRGGTKPTVTDACLVLGYIDPDYFLGGAMRVDRAAAVDAIMRDVGTPLNMDVQTAASAIFQLACERMVTAIDEITLRQGIERARGGRDRRRRRRRTVLRNNRASPRGEACDYPGGLGGAQRGRRVVVRSHPGLCGHCPYQHAQVRFRRVRANPQSVEGAMCAIRRRSGRRQHPEHNRLLGRGALSRPGVGDRGSAA